MKFKNMKVKYKVYLLAAFIITVFTLLIMLYILPTVNQVVEDRTILKLTEVTDLPLSEIKRQYELAQAKEKTEEQAKADALTVIENMRYSEVEYFWVNDMQGQMLMHAAKPALNQTSVWDMQDPDGVYVFREFIAAVEKIAKASCAICGLNQVKKHLNLKFLLSKGLRNGGGSSEQVFTSMICKPFSKNSIGK